MAGHSHWANIAHKKGRIDKKRGMLFGKLSRAIIVAAQNGGGDPDMNLALRYAIDKAKKSSMPKDNIDRAIKRGTGEGQTEQFEELVYEGYGPAGVAVMCDVLTENRNRTGPVMNQLFEANGGNLGKTGCVAWMFERKGFFVISKDQIGEEKLFELALEAGADDVVSSGDNYEVTCPIDAYQDVSQAFADAKLNTEVEEFSRIPENTVDLDAKDGKKVLRLLEALEDSEDVQSVTANFNLDDDVMAQVMADED